MAISFVLKRIVVNHYAALSGPFITKPSGSHVIVVNHSHSVAALSHPFSTKTSSSSHVIIVNHSHSADAPLSRPFTTKPSPSDNHSITKRPSHDKTYDLSRDGREHMEGIEEFWDDWVVNVPWIMSCRDYGTHLRRDVPGFSEENLQVTVDNATIFVKGEFGMSLMSKKMDARIRLDKNIFKWDEIIVKIKDGVLDIFIPRVPKKRCEIMVE